MAIVAHLVQRAEAGGRQHINHIRNVIVAIDNAVDTTDPLVRARAVTLLNAAGHAIPAGYFDSNVVISTTFATAGEILAMAGSVHSAWT